MVAAAAAQHCSDYECVAIGQERGQGQCIGGSADARHLKKLVAAVAAVAFALLDAAAADAPAKVFGALPVNCLLHTACVRVSLCMFCFFQ